MEKRLIKDSVDHDLFVEQLERIVGRVAVVRDCLTDAPQHYPCLILYNVSNTYGSGVASGSYSVDYEYVYLSDFQS